MIKKIPAIDKCCVARFSCANTDHPLCKPIVKENEEFIECSIYKKIEV